MMKQHAGILDREIQTFEAHKGTLMDQAEGRFVLIKDNEILGTFDTFAAAARAGSLRLGNVPFLVREIREQENPVVLSYAQVNTRG